MILPGWVGFLLFLAGWMAGYSSYSIFYRLWEKAKARNAGWEFDLGSCLQLKCPNCGRERVTRCMNGLLLCEKCDYSPDLRRIITDEENP